MECDKVDVFHERSIVKSFIWAAGEIRLMLTGMNLQWGRTVISGSARKTKFTGVRGLYEHACEGLVDH